MYIFIVLNTQLEHIICGRKTGEKKAVRGLAFARGNLELAQNVKYYQYKIDQPQHPFPPESRP